MVQESRDDEKKGADASPFKSLTRGVTKLVSVLDVPLSDDQPTAFARAMVEHIGVLQQRNLIHEWCLEPIEMLQVISRCYI